jgi:hypothetical protein
MNKSFSNPCSRCGKERIIVKTWKEKIGDLTIINTDTTCPNPECQKKVEDDNKRQRDRNAAIKLRSEQRIRNRRNTRKVKR